MKHNSAYLQQIKMIQIETVLQPFKLALFQYFLDFQNRNLSKTLKRQQKNVKNIECNDFFQNLINFLEKKQAYRTIEQHNCQQVLSEDKQQYQENYVKQKNDVLKYQTSYNFLRNIWGSHYFNRVSSLQNNEDRLDKINKIVGMMKQRINYMSKKQTYFYEKEQLQIYKKSQRKLDLHKQSDKQKIQLKNFSQYIFNNPIFQRLKQDFQKVKMENEQYKKKVEKLKQQISQLTQKNKILESSFKQTKKKSQQLQIKLIQNGKKNINLERQIIDLKSDTFKLKEKVKQLDDIKSACSDSVGRNIYYDNYTSSQAHQLNQQMQQPQSLRRVSSGIFEDQTFQSIILKDKIQNYNGREDKLNFKSVVKSSYRYSSSKNQENQINLNQPINKNIQEVKQNQQEKLNFREPLKNFTYRYQNDGKLTASSSKLNFKQQVPISFRYIKDSGSARKSLLSSVKSVDNFDKQSISKLRFQRTKVIGNNLQKNGRKCSQDLSKGGMISNIKKKCWATGTGLNQNSQKIL